MLFSPKISLNALVELCRRLAMSFESGLDARRVWAQEALQAHGSAKSRLLAVSEAVNRGETFAQALSLTGEFFPQVFRELVAVGEQTGHLAEIFAQLAEHYQHKRQLRRTFLAAIAWPVIQFAMAISVIGFLIWIVGIINESRGGNFDPLGFGLTGNRGLAIYVTFLAMVAAAVVAVAMAVRAGALSTRPIERLLAHVPVLGKAVQTLGIARLCWVLHATLNAGMDVRRAIALSLHAARLSKFDDDLPRIDAAIARGSSFHEAFVEAGGYPRHFLDAVAVGEQSGKLVESLATLSRQYNEQSRMAFAMLTLLAGYVVWAAVAGLIILLIFRVFSSYLAILDKAGRM